MKTSIYKCLNCGHIVNDIPDDKIERERTKTRNKLKRMKDLDDPNEL